ncbi:MAG: type II toxin-antitoxin system death-on-curing family toxin [Acidimicrobiia bacterium]
MGADREIEYLSLEDVLMLAADLLGDPPPVRDVGLLASALARPRTTVFGVDAYADVWEKAAALLQSVLKNHALVDGNKRLGWLSTAVFLELNGIEISMALNADVYEVVVETAASTFEIPEIASTLRALIDLT